MTADPGPHSGPADRLLVIGAAQFTRFEQTRDDADLDAVLAAAQQAAAVAAAYHPDRTEILMFLGACLGLRFELHGDAADLDEAVQVTQQAVAASPAYTATVPGISPSWQPPRSPDSISPTTQRTSTTLSGLKPRDERDRPNSTFRTGPVGRDSRGDRNVWKSTRV